MRRKAKRAKRKSGVREEEGECKKKEAGGGRAKASFLNTIRTLAPTFDRDTATIPS